MSSLSTPTSAPVIAGGYALPSAQASGRASRTTEATQATTRATVPVPTQQPPGPDALQKLVDTMQTKAKSAGSDLQFSIDQDSGRSIVKVTERSSKDVIWQFPSEQALQVTKELDRFQSMLSRKA